MSEGATTLRPLPTGCLWVLCDHEDDHDPDFSWNFLGIFSSPDRALFWLANIAGLPKGLSIDDVFWWQGRYNPGVIQGYCIDEDDGTVYRWRILAQKVDVPFGSEVSETLPLLLHTELEAEARWDAEERGEPT